MSMSVPSQQPNRQTAKPQTSYDVTIVGGGAAGLTAALYAARRGLSVVVLSQDIGGQASTTGTIENYPGFDIIDGFELMMKFKTQAEKYGAVVKLEEVKKLEREENGFRVTTVADAYHSRTVIVANGLMHKHLNVPGEEEFNGKGVSYCATCDAPLFKGKNVAVVGGGNSAMDAALLLAKLCPQVTIITSNAEFRGERVLIDRMNQTPNIKQILNGKTQSIEGDTTVTGITVEHDGTPQHIVVQGVFVEVGYTVNPKLVADLVPLDQQNQIIIDHQTNGTSVPGLFAAGDVTTIQQKQIVISAGEGAKAALAVDQYLQSLGHKPKTGVTDWGVSATKHYENS